MLKKEIISKGKTPFNSGVFAIFVFFRIILFIPHE